MNQPPSATRRLFIGLMPDAGVRQALEEHRNAWQWSPGQKLVRPERLHVTLHFLGDVAVADEAILHEALRGIHAQPFELVLQAAAIWRREVAVLLAAESRAALALHTVIGAAIQAAPPALPWKPHVTLARKPLHVRPPEVVAPIRWPVREFALVHSMLGPRARYEIVERYPLR